MLRDIPDDFEILSASPKDDMTMTVKAKVHGINTMELAVRVRTAKAQVLSGNWVIELEDYKALVSDLMVSDQGYQSDAG